MLRLATTADARRLGRTMQRAFAADPVFRWLFPDDDDYAEAGQLTCQRLVNYLVAANLTWCTNDGVAFAGWLAPQRPAPSTEPPIEHPEPRQAKVEALRTAMKANTPDEDHWYLHILATHPDWQSQGLGSDLLDVMFTMHDQLGLPYYLETQTEALVGFYERHGFVVRTQWELDYGGPTMWGMLRRPNALS